MSAPKRIFCGGLPKKLGEDAFREYFQQFGELVDVDLMKRPGDDRNRGFGFVKYTDFETSEKVINMEHILEGQKLTVNYAKVPLPKNTRRYFIGSINKDQICEEDLTNYFQKYGTVEDVVIMKEKNFGFVALHNEDHAQLDAVLNITHTINGEALKLEPAKPKQKQRDMGPGMGGRHGGPMRFSPYGAPMGGWGGPAPFGPYGHNPYGPPPSYGMRNPEYETYDVKPSSWKPPAQHYGGGRGAPPPRGPPADNRYNPHRDAPASGGSAPPPYGTGSGYAPPGVPPSYHAAPPPAPNTGAPNTYSQYGSSAYSASATSAPTSGFGGPAPAPAPYNPYNSHQPTQTPAAYQAPPPSTGAPTNQPYTGQPSTNYPPPAGYGQPPARPAQNTYTSYGQPTY